MKHDFDLITHKFSRNLSHINLYPVGDVHVGSPNFVASAWNRWKKIVLADPYGKVVITGDMLDIGLKKSKTNSYNATMRPRDQKEWLQKELEPLKGRILGACEGNHEYRSSLVADICPLYDVMVKLDIEDYYRENMAFMKVSLGQKNKERQYSYTIVLAHGVGRAKTEQFGYSIEGADVFITGHDHQPRDRFPARLIIDPYNEQVRLAEFIHLVVPSFQIIGDYALRGMYLPQSICKIPIITLSGEEKGTEVRWI